MNKAEFLAALESGLAGLPQDEIDERLAFYGEMIDDRMEEGLPEEEAVAGIGPVDRTVSQIISDIPLTRLVKEKIRPKRSLRAWEIVLIVLGFPLWFPLLAAAGAVVLSLYVVLWALILTLWAVFAAFAACAAGGIALAVVWIVRGSVVPGIAMIGLGLFSAGIAIFLFFGCVGATKGTARLTKKILLGIKTLFIRKESAK